MTFCLRASLLSESEQRRGKRRPSMACCAFKNNERQPPWARPPLVRRLCHCGLLPRHTPALSTWPPRSKANRNGWEPSPRPVPPSVPPPTPHRPPPRKGAGDHTYFSEHTSLPSNLCKSPFPQFARENFSRENKSPLPTPSPQTRTVKFVLHSYARVWQAYLRDAKIKQRKSFQAIGLASLLENWKSTILLYLIIKYDTSVFH